MPLVHSPPAQELKRCHPPKNREVCSVIVSARDHRILFRRYRNLLQIARPDGNAFERWKWHRRYFIWTWSLSGALICVLRLAVNPARPHWDFFSWFTLSSYLLALPVAAILGAIISAVLWYFHRDWTIVAHFGSKAFTFFAWAFCILALLFVAVLLIRVFLPR